MAIKTMCVCLCMGGSLQLGLSLMPDSCSSSSRP